MASSSNATTTPSTIRTTRKRDRNDEDDDGIIINLERSAVRTPNSSSSSNNKQRTGDTTSTYTSPVATSTSFLGRALSAVTSTVFKRRKVSSPIVEEQQPTAIGSNGKDSTENPRTDDLKVEAAEHEQPKSFLSPRSPTRKVLQLDLYGSHGKSTVQPAASKNFTNNYSSLMLSHNGPAPPVSALPPYQSSLLKRQQYQAGNANLQQNANIMTTSAITNPKTPSFPISSTDQVLFSLNAPNRKDQANSLDFAFGRLKPKSHLFLQSSRKARKQHPNYNNNKNKLSATETSKRILTALEEQRSLSLMPPPEAPSYVKPTVSIFGGRDSYNSRLPGTHPFAPTLPPPPPKKRLAQISSTPKPSSQLVQPSTKTAIIKTIEENQKQQQQPAAILTPMTSSQAIVTIHDTLLQLKPSTTPMVSHSHRKLPSQSQVRQHLQNIRQSMGYLESYQKIMKDIDTSADSFINITQENAVDDELVKEVITELVEGKIQDYGDISRTNGVVCSIFSCQKERSSKRKPLLPKTTTGDAWWSTINSASVQEKVTNSTTQSQHLPPLTKTTATEPIASSTPYSCPLLDKPRNYQITNKSTVAVTPAKKSRLGDAGDLPCEPLKQVDANILFQFGNKLDKPGPRDTTTSEAISSQFTPRAPHKEQQQSNQTVDVVTTSDSTFWGRHLLQPGQWKCSVCTVKNDAKSSKCTSCEAPKQQEDQKQVGSNHSIKQSTNNGGPLNTSMAIPMNGETSKEKGGSTLNTSATSTLSINGPTTSASSSFLFGTSTSANSTAAAPQPIQFGPSTTEPGAPVGFTFGASSGVSTGTTKPSSDSTPSAGFMFGSSSGFTTGTTKPSSDSTPSTGFTFGSSSGFTTGTTKPSSDTTISNVGVGSGGKGFLFGSVSTETKASVYDAVPSVSQLPISAPKSSVVGSSSNSSSNGSATLKSVILPVATQPPATVSSVSAGTAVTGQIQAPIVGADVSGGAVTSFGSSVGVPPPLLFGTSGTSASAPAISGFSFGAAPSTSSDGSGFQFRSDSSKGPSFENSTAKPATFALNSGNASAISSTPSSSFSFGAVPPAVTQDQPVLSFGTSNIAAPAPAPAPAVSSFSFGSTSAPSVNAQTAAASTSFFGGSTSGTTGSMAPNPFVTTGINSSFQKDTNAPSIIATAPSSTFSFGSTTGSTPVFSAPMQASFGAMQVPPTSGLQQAGSLGSMPAGGGFSLGTGGSTGAKRRIIKAKRPSMSR